MTCNGDCHDRGSKQEWKLLHFLMFADVLLGWSKASDHRLILNLNLPLISDQLLDMSQTTVVRDVEDHPARNQLVTKA